MGRIFVVAALGAVVVGSASVAAGELPTFEKSGLPVTHVQVSVLGSAGVQERSPMPDLTLHGMPASPHQIAVLSHHPKTAENGSRPGFPTTGSRTVTAYRASNE